MSILFTAEDIYHSLRQPRSNSSLSFCDGTAPCKLLRTSSLLTNTNPRSWIRWSLWVPNNSGFSIIVLLKISSNYNLPDIAGPFCQKNSWGYITYVMKLIVAKLIKNWLKMLFLLLLLFIVETLLYQQPFLRKPITKYVCLYIHAPVFYFLSN